MKKNRVFLILQAAVCVALAVWLSVSAVSLYLEGAERKTEHPAESIYTQENVAGKLAPAVPLLIVGLCLTIAGLVRGVKDENAGKPAKDAAAQRKQPVFRKRPEEEKTEPVTAGPEGADPPKKTAPLQVLLIAAAVLLIIAGVLNGSALDVLYKAITICTECIGLG